MFFLLGTRSKAKALGQVERACTKCGKHTMQTAIESKRWFTLFFIPVISLGTNHVVRCNLCGLTMKTTPDIQTQLASKAMAARA